MASRVALALVISAAFLAGAMSSRLFARTARPVGAESAFDLRGPPTKAELGHAGWILLHTIAANFPEAPSRSEQRAARQLLTSLSDLYPCRTCAAHLRSYIGAHDVAVGSREALSRWACELHNDVNRRNGKEAFFCDAGVLDHRWKDCGCGKSASNKTAVVRLRK